MPEFSRKIALGTVQFGLDYGISNTAGQVPEAEVASVLQLAAAQGVSVLDTAAAYGQSEAIIGKALQQQKLAFQVVSKLPDCGPAQVRDVLQMSLDRLGLSSLYGYLIHDFGWFTKHPSAWIELQQLQQEGKVGNIGFSLYYPEQAEWLLEHGYRPDLVQLPYSVLDQRFEQVMARLKAAGTEIHARSVFLQGLLLLEPGNLQPYFGPVRSKLAALHKLFSEHQIPLAAGLLTFAWLHPHIDQLVIGVQSREQLESNLRAAGFVEKTRHLYDQLRSFAEQDPAMVVPSNWKL